MSETAPSTASLRAVLPFRLRSARLARRLVEELLADADATTPLTQDAAVVVYELVANAVIHGSRDGSDSLALECTADQNSCTVTVLDGGSPAPGIAARPLTWDRPDGRGLQIVAALSTWWTVDRSAGTLVSAHLSSATGDSTADQ